jgi:signal transduction histidine kinase
MVVSAIVDISERKRLERVHNEFISIVSHELRTPITSIGASLGLLLVGGAQNLPQPAVHLLKIAHSNCQRLVRLVNDILTVEKLAAGEMPFRFQRCDGRTLLETAIEANRGFAGSVGVRCEVPAEPFELYVDPDRFTQIIINLLSNAVKFSPPGGVVDVGAEKRGDHVRITVRDHGPGIPAEFRPRMFEKFAQAEAADGQKKGGTGLGLNIVREIVMHMHGQVGFEDAAGGGTVFYVDLPGADQAANWQSQVAPAPNLTRLPKTQRAPSKRRASVTNQAS